MVLGNGESTSADTCESIRSQGEGLCCWGGGGAVLLGMGESCAVRDGERGLCWGGLCCWVGLCC